MESEMNTEIFNCHQSWKFLALNWPEHVYVYHGEILCVISDVHYIQMQLLESGRGASEQLQGIGFSMLPYLNFHITSAVLWTKHMYMYTPETTFP